MATETPESDFSIECFQNYSAPEVFVQGLAGMVDQTDIETIIRAQKNMLQRFEKTTEMLTNCNQLSASRLRAASVEFKKHTQLLVDMKKDLEYIFKKIRAIKTKLSTQYPEAYKEAVAVAMANRKPIEDEDDDEGGFKTSQTVTQSKMVTTASTETLKPTTSQDWKKAKKKDENHLEKDMEKTVLNRKQRSDNTKRNSSSSETECTSSGNESTYSGE